MARRNLNKRSFRKNQRNFLNRISKAPVKVLVEDVVSGNYEMTIDTHRAEIASSKGVPGNVSLDAVRASDPLTNTP